MQILIISLEESGLQNHTDILDFLVLPETARGKDHPNYWIINSQAEIGNPDNNEGVNIANQLFFNVRQNFSTLIIKKYAEQPESTPETGREHEDMVATGPVASEESGNEVPPSSMGS